MNGTLRTVASLILADFLERVRRYSFLVTMLAAVYLGYAVNAGYITLTLGKYRGAYNSAWIGTMVALSAALFISLVGFYIVKNSVSRDRTTRVGQILAGTPVGSFTYLLSKTISNFLVLAAIVAVQVLAAILMQLLSGAGFSLDLGAMLLPFALITLPALAFVSAVAVLFESVRWLSGGFGNVAFFILFMGFISLPLAADLRGLDVLSIRGVEANMHEAARAAYPEFDGGFQLQVAPPSLQDDATRLKTFVWNGMDWTLSAVADRMTWFGYAFLLTLLAVPFFDRFDEATAGRLNRRRKREGAKEGVEEAAQPRQKRNLPAAVITAVTSVPLTSRLGRMLVAEFRLMLKGVHTAWYLVALGFIIAGFTVPVETAKHEILAFTWIWPVLLWSKMGMREAYFGTSQLIFSAPRIRARQMFAVWGAGVAVAAVTGSGVALNLMVSGEWGSLPGMAVGMLFIPSLALAFGVWSTTSKLFEAVYTVWWYVGPLNNTPALDFTGTSSTWGTTAGYILLTVACIAVGYAGRRRQMSG
jgi:hypothetical protein